ncbi:MAG TPA: hypothetical protein VHZ78_12405 [Rhizomicrobium sp.]|jgi:hypothetical protein|nr:hypothetical protein [Rhizomicrobium sp.]
MNGMLFAAGFGAGLVGGLTDWLFMGVLFHDAYNRFPEVWRPGIRAGSERSAIIWSSMLGFVMSGAVVALCAIAGIHGIVAGLEIAALVWLAGPFVVVVVNGFFIKIDNRITVAHCIGWLARMLIAGAAAGFVLHA